MLSAAANVSLVFIFSSAIVMRIFDDLVKLEDHQLAQKLPALDSREAIAGPMILFTLAWPC